MSSLFLVGVQAEMAAFFWTHPFPLTFFFQGRDPPPPALFHYIQLKMHVEGEIRVVICLPLTKPGLPIVFSYLSIAPLPLLPFSTVLCRVPPTFSMPCVH